MSISKTVATWAEVRLESTMCSAVFLRIGDMGTTSPRAPDEGVAGGAPARGGPPRGGGGGGGATDPAGGASGAAGAPTGATTAAPSAAITATTVLMGTVAPGWTRISFRTPVAGAGISASTLSVEISNSGSSRCTRSPTFFIHLVTVPSAIDSPIWGMITSVIHRPPNTLVIIDGPDGFAHLVRVGQEVLF